MIDYTNLWKHISTSSNNFKENFLVKGFFSNYFATNQLVKETFNNLKLDDYSVAMRTVRVFNDYTLNTHLTQSILSSSFLPNESLDDWMKRELKTDEHFIILANVERISEAFSKHVSEMVSPLVKDYHFPCMTAEIYIIMGRYGLTPLGIHYDSPTGDWHRVFQVNLGPGKKVMHIWKRDEFQDLMNSKLKNQLISREKVLDLIPHATSYVLEEGDALLFSPDDYHIAESDEFSVSLSMILFNNSKKAFQETAIQEYALEMLNDYSQGQNDNTAFHPKEEYFATEDSTTQVLSNPKWIEKALRDNEYKYLSNQYLKAPPILKPFKFQNLQEILSYSISANPPFFMLVKQQENELDIFIRGKKIMLYAIPGLAEFIEELNQGITISIQDFAKKLSAFIDNEAIFLVIQKLYMHGGILIYSN